MTEKKEKKKERKGAWWRKYTQKYVDEELVSPDVEEKKSPQTKERKAIPVATPDPFAELNNVHRQLDKAFKDLFSRDFFGRGFFRTPELPRIMRMDEGLFRKPVSNVKETRKDVLVAVELPGVKKEDIRIRMEGLNLIVDAQTRREEKKEKEGSFGYSASYNGFRHIIRLPCEVDKTKSKAHFERGILQIALPKKKPSDEGSGDIGIE